MKILFLAVALFLSLVLYGTVLCSAASQPPQKVAILPFTTGGQENIDYIADGLRDMIASRIASGSAVVVLEQSMVKGQFPRAVKETLPPAKVMEIGRALGADYVVFGSMAKMGNALIIAINMLSVSAGGTTAPVFAQTLGLDEVIPRMQLIAQEIRDGIANGLQTPKAAPAGVPPPGEPDVKVEDGIADDTAAPRDGVAPDMLLQGEGSGAAPPTSPQGRGEEDSNEAPGQKEEAAGELKQFLLERKGTIDSSPENPVYQKSLEELQNDTGIAQ